MIDNLTVACSWRPWLSRRLLVTRRFSLATAYEAERWTAKGNTMKKLHTIILICTLIALALVHIAAVPVVADQKNHIYTNDEYGFSFNYPDTWGCMEVKNGKDTPSWPDKDAKLIFSVGCQVPELVVVVYENPKEMDLLTFAYKHVLFGELYNKREIGVTETEVAGEKAFQMTYFTKPGTGCATSVVFLSHNNHIFYVNPACNSEALPQILDSFRFQASEKE